MTDSTPPPAQPEGSLVPGYRPTGSTWGSAAGAALGAILLAILKQKCHLEFDETTGALILAGAAGAGGYFFEGGRK